MAARSGRASILGVGRLLAGGFKYLLFFNVFQLYQGLLDMMIFFGTGSNQQAGYVLLPI